MVLKDTFEMNGFPFSDARRSATARGAQCPPRRTLGRYKGK